MLTLLQILQRTTGFLEEKGVESPRLNAELLIAHALGLPRMQLYLQFERPLGEAELERIRPLVRRRARREPLQYILGQVEFSGLTLRVDRRALIPRPETEGLVELLLSQPGERPRRILDLGTGSGAIALALAVSLPGADVLGVDASAEALALAGENARGVGGAERVRWRQAHWFAGLPAENPFDWIVANPPYLSAEETAASEPEVHAFEPAMALTAEAGGLADLRHIVFQAPAFLAPGGLLALETGPSQHGPVGAWLAEAGFRRHESHRDLAQRDRYLLAWL